MTGTAGVRNRSGSALPFCASLRSRILAHQVATIDQVSDGRVVLGVGIAADTSNPCEFEAVGVPFGNRSATRWKVSASAERWSGDPVDWDGRWKLQQAVVNR